HAEEEVALPRTPGAAGEVVEREQDRGGRRAPTPTERQGEGEQRPRRRGDRRAPRGGWKSASRSAEAAPPSRPRSGSEKANSAPAVAASQPRSTRRQARSPAPSTATIAQWTREIPGRFMSKMSRYGTSPCPTSQPM